MQQVIERLRELGASDMKEMAGEVETTVFSLPEELARK